MSEPDTTRADLDSIKADVVDCVSRSFHLWSTGVSRAVLLHFFTQLAQIALLAALHYRLG